MAFFRSRTLCNSRKKYSRSPICRRLLRRPTDLSAASADYRSISPCRGRFGPPPDPLSRPADLSTKSVDYRPNPADFRLIAADSVRHPIHRRARPIYWLPRSITGQTRPIFAPSPLIRFGARTKFAPGRFNSYLGRLPADFCSAA
jgi:hypothetical protein